MISDLMENLLKTRTDTKRGRLHVLCSGLTRIQLKANGCVFGSCKFMEMFINGVIIIGGFVSIWKNVQCKDKDH